MTGKRRTIMLFFQQLPHHVTQHDLRLFIVRALRSASLPLPLVGNPISHCEILRITDRQTGQVEHHGLVEIGPARIAIQAIEILNGRNFEGHIVAVHRYRHRGIWTGQVKDPREDPPSGQDRRRHNLMRDLLPSPAKRGGLATWVKHSPIQGSMRKLFPVQQRTALG